MQKNYGSLNEMFEELTKYVEDSERKSNGRGAKIYKRLADYNYEKYLASKGFKVMLETKHYPIYLVPTMLNGVKCFLVIGMTFCFAYTEKGETLLMYDILKPKYTFETVKNLGVKTDCTVFILWSKLMNRGESITYYHPK